MGADHLIVADALELVGRRLRMLGFDVEPAGAVRLEQLFARARDRGRVALTSSARHPRRFADVIAVTLPRSDPAAAVRAVAERFVPTDAPFTRCPRCNVPLEPRAAVEARGAAPDDVVARGAALRHCPACGRWFWQGSHTDRIRAWLSAALGREVPGPPEGPRP